MVVIIFYYSNRHQKDYGQVIHYWGFCVTSSFTKDWIFYLIEIMKVSMN